jgi:two-component system sensor histidine kinase/response regulator
LAGQTLNSLFKKLQEQTDRLQHILDTAPVGVAVTAGGVIQFANPKVSELLDMKMGDAATQALVNPETREQIIAELKAHGSVTNMEVQMYCPLGTVRDLLVTYLPMDYEGKPGTLGWMIDITERKGCRSPHAL